MIEIFADDDIGGSKPWNHPLAEQAKGATLEIDREFGKVTNPVVNTNGYGSVTVLDPGSNGKSFEMSAHSWPDKNELYLVVQEGAEGLQKPMRGMWDGRLVVGYCR